MSHRKHSEDTKVVIDTSYHIVLLTIITNYNKLLFVPN